MQTVVLLILGVAAGGLVNLLADKLPPEPRPSQTRSWLVLLSGAGIGFALGMFPAEINPFLALGILTYFGAVAVIDLEHRLILHGVSLVGAVLAAIIGTILHGWYLTLFGGLAGLGIMLLFYLFGMAFSKIRARQRGADDGEEALGFGDVTISGVLGLLLGWPDVWLMLIAGVFLGGAVSLLIVAGQLLFRRYKPMETFTAYGPYLLLGATALLFFRSQVLDFFFHY